MTVPPTSRRTRVITWTRISLIMIMMSRMMMSPMSRATIRMRIRIGAAMIWRRRNPQARSVLISCVTPKKYTRNWDLKYSMLNIASCVDRATRTIAIMISANSANRSTRVQVMPTMTISGLGVTNVIDGYICY